MISFKRFKENLVVCVECNAYMGAFICSDVEDGISIVRRELWERGLELIVDIGHDANGSPTHDFSTRIRKDIIN